MTRLTYPIPGAPLSDGFGPRDPIATAGGTSGSFHNGQDFIAAEGTPIRAAGAGVVIASAWIGTYGNAVYLDHGDGLVTRYAHMLALPPVGRGQHVERGERIGFVGSTGASTGPHLHFEVVKDGVRVDPLSYLTTTPPTPPEGQEAEDDMRPIYFKKQGKSDYLVIHPQIGEELATGKTRTSGKVTYGYGYMTTSSPGIGSAWSKMYHRPEWFSVTEGEFDALISEAQRAATLLSTT